MVHDRASRQRDFSALRARPLAGVMLWHFISGRLGAWLWRGARRGAGAGRRIASGNL